MKTRVSFLSVTLGLLLSHSPLPAVEMLGLRADVRNGGVRLAFVPPTSEPMAFHFANTPDGYSLYFFAANLVNVPDLEQAARWEPANFLQWLNETVVSPSNHFFGARAPGSWSDFRIIPRRNGFNALVTNSIGAFLLSSVEGQGGYLYPLDNVAQPERLLAPSPVTPAFFSALGGGSAVGSAVGITKSGAGTLALGGANTFTGGIVLNTSSTLNMGGTLQLGANATLVATGPAVDAPLVRINRDTRTVGMGSITIGGDRHQTPVTPAPPVRVPTHATLTITNSVRRGSSSSSLHMGGHVVANVDVLQLNANSVPAPSTQASSRSVIIGVAGMVTHINWADFAFPDLQRLNASYSNATLIGTTPPSVTGTNAP